jgi:membrane fusion protein, epimerase transport system
MATPESPDLLAAVRGRIHRDAWRVGRVGFGVLAAVCAAFAAWGAFAPLSGAVVAPGVVIVDAYRKAVQHLEGGIVREIRVRPGQRVAKGDVLILLEDVQQSAAVGTLSDQLATELARGARLTAEREQRAAIAWPDDFAKRRSELRIAEILRDEQSLFDARRKLLTSQVGQLEAQIRQVEEEIAGLTAQIKSAEESLRYLRDEMRMNEKLHKEGYVQETRMLAFKRAIAEKEEKRGEYVASIAQAKQRSSELRLRIISLHDSYVREATEQRKEAGARVLELRERMRPNEDALGRRTIRAPIAGEVVNLKVHAMGAVITPGETLMEIVPDERLVAEARIQPQDIAQVRRGGEAHVQLSAFKQRTTPLVAGKVIYISGDALTESVNGMPMLYFVAHVEVDAKSLVAAGDLSLSPGMPVVVFIKTRERSALDYITEPVTDSLRRAMREQ